MSVLEAVKTGILRLYCKSFRITGLLFLIACTVGMFTENTSALERPDREFKVFQFPPNMIPTIDGKTGDWDIVPDDYSVGIEELRDTVGNNPIDRKDLVSR